MPQIHSRPDQRQQETERLADDFALKATRDILKPDNGLSVLEALEKKSMRDAESGVPHRRYPVTPDVAAAVSETRKLVDDLHLRIIRQRRRVDKIIIERLGPRKEMEGLLADMIKARDIMRGQLDSFETDRKV